MPNRFVHLQSCPVIQGDYKFRLHVRRRDPLRDRGVHEYVEPACLEGDSVSRWGTGRIKMPLTALFRDPGRALHPDVVEFPNERQVRVCLYDRR